MSGTNERTAECSVNPVPETYRPAASWLIGVVIVHAFFSAFCYQLPGWPVWGVVIYSQPALLAAWTALANHMPGPFRFAMSLILLSLSTLANAWSSYLRNDFVELSVQDIILGLVSLTQFLCLLIPMLVLRMVVKRLRKTLDSPGKILHRRNLSLLHLVGLMSASALVIELWAMLLRNADLSDSDMFGRQYLLRQIQHGAIIAGLTLPIVLNLLLIFGQNRRISLSVLILLVLVPLASAIRALDPTVDFDLQSLWSMTQMLVSFHLSVFLTLVALRFAGVRMCFR